MSSSSTYDIDDDNGNNDVNEGSSTNPEQRIKGSENVMRTTTNLLGQAKPVKMWIDGQCFDVGKFYYINQSISGKPYIQNMLKRSIVPSIHQKYKFNITRNESGQYTTSFELPKVYYQKLMTFPRFNLTQLGAVTKTRIILPEEDDDTKMHIFSTSKDSVLAARCLIHSAVAEIRDQIRPFQFLSIPTSSAEIIENFLTFKQNVLGDQYTDIDRSIFMSPIKLHLTIAVLTLMNEREITEASKALQEFKATVLNQFLEKSEPLIIRVSGVSFMGQSVQDTGVIYANADIINRENVQRSGVLQTLADSLSDYFYERGFTRKSQKCVKLHMTLMNTKYMKKNECKRPKKGRFTFDATKLIDKYKNYYFGECKLNSVYLSEMARVGPDGYYKPLSIISV